MLRRVLFCAYHCDNPTGESAKRSEGQILESQNPIASTLTPFDPVSPLPNTQAPKSSTDIHVQLSSWASTGGRIVAADDRQNWESCEQHRGCIGNTGYVLFCLPLLIRFRRVGRFEIRINTDLDLQTTAQRSMVLSVINCQRPLTLRCFRMPVPIAFAGKTQEFYNIKLENVSDSELYLDGVEVSSESKYSLYLTFQIACKCEK